MEIERPEIVELFYSALIGHADVEQLFRFEELIQFLSPRVEWILSAADPRTLGEESPPNAIKFSGKEGFRQLALYFRDRLHVISGSLDVLPITSSFSRLEESVCDLLERGGWQKQILLPNLHFTARKLSKAKSGSPGRWCFEPWSWRRASISS